MGRFFLKEDGVKRELVMAYVNNLRMLCVSDSVN